MEQSATTTEEQRLADALVDIAKDATVAKTAARFLNRTARCNWTLRRKYWFTDPERIGRLVQALRFAARGRGRDRGHIGGR